MATGDELCGTWRILATDNTNPQTYPGNNFVTIGKQGNTFTMVWLDKNNHLLVFSDLKLADLPSRLEALHATTTAKMNVSISYGASGIWGIVERVNGSDGQIDPGLSGQWGADAPPPRLPAWLVKILRLLRIIR
ncbi:MAG: hypothetical protein ABUT39_26330 [Acidobacteriota bacterium]